VTIALDQLVLTREGARTLDRLAGERYAIPSIVLMENASRGAADAARDLLPSGPDSCEALVFCGPGNNGGDGFACARHLHNAGARVRLVLLADPDKYKADAATNLEIVRRMRLPLSPFDADEPPAPTPRPDLVIDAIFGTGLTRPVGGPFARAVERLNALGALGVPVLALDLPSGLDAETGRPLGTAVRASRTVTFEALKPAMLELPAQRYLGDIVVAPIGVPRELTEALASACVAAPHRRAIEPRARPTEGPGPARRYS